MDETLKIKIVADSSGADRVLKSTKDSLASIVDAAGIKVPAAFGKMKLGAIGAAAAVTALAVSIGKLALNVSKAGDEIDKQSQKVGMSARAYQEWSHVLEHCGASAESLSRAMRKLVNARASGSEAFSSIGVDPNAYGSQEALFKATVAALQSVENQMDRAQLAAQLMGESAQELAPLLNTSAAETEKLIANYNRLGAVMNDNLVQMSAHMQDSVTNLSASFQGLKNTIGELVIPILDTLAQKLTTIIAQANTVLRYIFDLGDGGSSGVQKDIGTQVAVSMQSAVSSAKQLRYLISGFDELNIMSSSGSSGASSGSSGSGSGYSAGVTAFNTSQLLDETRKQTDTLKATGDDVKAPTWMETLRDVVRGIKNNDVTAVNLGAAIGEKIHDVAANVAEAGKSIKDGLKEKVQDIGAAAAGAWDALKEKVSGLISSVTGKTTTPEPEYKSTYTPSTAGSSGVTHTSGGGRTIVDTIQSGVEAAKNALENALKKMKSSISTSTSTAGVSHTTGGGRAFASGGVVYGPTIGLVGEYPGASTNPEIITPQNILSETIDASNGKLASVIAQATQQVIAALYDTQSSLSVDGVQLARAVGSANARNMKLTGSAYA